MGTAGGDSTDRPGFVYFIHAPAAKRIKIGYAYDPDERFDLLKTGSPVEYVRLGLVAGPRNLEREIHARFAKHRRHGEWFLAGKAILRYVEENASVWKSPKEKRQEVSREYAERAREGARVYEELWEQNKDRLCREAMARFEICPYPTDRSKEKPETTWTFRPTAAPPKTHAEWKAALLARLRTGESELIRVGRKTRFARARRTFETTP